jgi:nucleotide-binding universal stress UspA family protein
MQIRKLLLPLTGGRAADAALETALAIARIWNAHLTALHVRVDSRDVAPLAGDALSGALIEQMMSATERESAERANAIQAMFEGSVTRQGVVVGEPRPGAAVATANFATVIGREDDLVAQLARLADLTIVPHPEGGEDVSSSDALHAVLFDSGRPVLIAPRAVPASIGRRVAIAWNGTAESAAAVWAAIPWMQHAVAVCVLSADEYQRRGPSAADLAGYLACHDVHPELATFRPLDRDVGAGLLAAAHGFGADLLAMGAYSHSRLRQLILGGVTRHVLEHADLPVMMCR